MMYCKAMDTKSFFPQFKYIETMAMNSKTIGTHAGLVWVLLSDGRRWRYSEMQAQLKLRDRELNAALGWLARENKIGFEQSGRDLWIYLLEQGGGERFF